MLEQARLLRTKAAKLYAKVEFIRENNKIVGYVISAVSVVLAGAEIAAGFTLIGTMTPLGVLAGAILVTDGTNSISKEVARYATNNTTSEGLVANAAMSTAEFMGFSRENGLGVYKSISLAAKEVAIKWSAAPDMTPQTVLYRRPVAQFSNFQPKIVSSWLILALFQANFLISGRSRLCPYQLVNSNQVRQGE